MGRQASNACQAISTQGIERAGAGDKHVHE